MLSKVVGLFVSLWALLVGIFAAIGDRLRAIAARINAFVPFGQLSGKLMAIIVGLFATALLGATLTVIGLGLENRAFFPFDHEILVALGGHMTVIAGISVAMTAVLFFIAWPLDQRGIIEGVIVKSGIRQLNRVSTGLVAGVLGVVVAAIISLTIAYSVAFVTGESTALAALNRWLIALVFVVVFVLSTVIALLAFRKNNETYVRTDLSVVDVHEYGEDRRELVVRNDSDEIIDFWKAKIEDTDSNRYRLAVDVKLRPGETTTFELPPGFELDPAIYDLPLGLALFYDDVRLVSIYARTGDTFILDWDETRDVADPPRLEEA